jgi:4-hydroxy-tetrahydrodipicolinate synthase
MKLRPLTGTLTALVTPFKQQQVAYGDLRRLVTYQIKGGINGLVPVGTTGESPTLSHEEHMDVVRATIEYAAGRVPVIAGTGSNSTSEAVELTVQAHAAGADGMLVVAPYYNKPSQEGLFRHFSAIADATDRDIVGVVERLRARFPHVRHIKEAGGNVERVDQLKQALGADITVLSGDDSLTLPFMAVGAQGVISVASNLLVKEIGQMVQAALANDFFKASKLHRRLYPISKALFVEPNPVPIKAALARAGIIASAEVRAPLCPMSSANRQLVLKTLRTLGY